jgi:4-amino-4-deoxy-L-arabinose transferase-like glycosyltransferase
VSGLVPILVVAFGLRLAWAIAIEVDPRAVFHWDMTFYDLAALRLVDGALLRDFDGVATAKWSPGYPIVLGAAYGLFGTSLWVAKLLNVVVSTLTVWLTAVLGTRLFDRTTGLVAAAILALLPGHVLYVPNLLSETLFVGLFAAVLVGFLVLEARRPERVLPRWLGFGALVGLSILVRGATALYLAVPAAWWWLTTRSWRVTLSRTAAAALGVALVVLPWTLRNQLTMGYPAIVSTQQVGMALTFAHSDVATGGMSMAMERYRDDLLRDLRDLPQPRREIEENRRETRRALVYLVTHPLRELSLVPRRWLHLFKHDHTGLTWSTPRGAGGVPLRPVVSDAWDTVIADVADGVFFALLLLAAWGLRRCLGAVPAERLLLPLTLLYFLLLHGVLFTGDPRFHAPLYPVLAVLAAAGSVDLVGRARARRG